MSDQGEKIIHLAREVLRSGRIAETTHEHPSHKAEAKMLSIKATALAALVAAFGGASLTHLVEETRRPINRYERVEIEALLFYASRQAAMPEEALRKDIQANLSLNSMNEITVFDYKRIREYLWERIQG